MIQSAPVGILEVDLDTRVIRWNPAAEEIFGLSSQAMDIASQSITAASRFDASTLRQLNAELAAKTPALNAAVDKYRSDKAECNG